MGVWPGQDHAILTVAQTSAADAAFEAAGAPVSDLIDRAAGAIVEAIKGRFTPVRTVVLCGPGNNGADGRAAADLLKTAGWPVVIAALKPQGEERPVSPDLFDRAGLIIDALFGAGLSRPLDASCVAVMKAAQACGAPIVAVDVPSGVFGDADRPVAYAPRAALTVTFHRKKPAHVLQPSRALCGEIVLTDIGLPPPQDADLFENDPDLWLARFPWPAEDGHKHDRGRLMVVSGGALQTGAARMSARAGLRIGAGLVTVLSPPSAVLVNAAHLEAVMLQSFKSPEDLAERAAHAQAVVIGPAAGVGDKTAANLTALAGTEAAIVVDADALTSFKDDTRRLFSLLGERDVLTPHEGEFERIFPGLLDRAPNKIAAAREAARACGAVVLLKGASTVIAGSDGRAVVNTVATPFLATAGSGDVLAGLIGGLIAQGLSSFDAACAAAWIHGKAAKGFGPGLIAEDLPGLVPGVLAALLSGAD